MTTMRVSLFLIMLGGAMYAAAGLFSSLHDVGIGMAIAALAMCMQGLLTYLHESDAKIMRRYRQDVWARRDGADW